jgi:hypothetical protein
LVAIQSAAVDGTYAKDYGVAVIGSTIQRGKCKAVAGVVYIDDDRDDRDQALRSAFELCHKKQAKGKEGPVPCNSEGQVEAPRGRPRCLALATAQDYCYIITTPLDFGERVFLGESPTGTEVFNGVFRANEWNARRDALEYCKSGHRNCEIIASMCPAKH